LLSVELKLGGFLRERRNQRDTLCTLERVKVVAETASDPLSRLNGAS
jgi:hypothetical protein